MHSIENNSSTSRPHSTSAWVYISLLCLSLLYYLFYLRYGVVQNDEGLLLDAAERMMRGEEWWVDFITPYGALRSWLLARLFAVTGVGFVPYRLFFILVRLVGLGLMLAVASRLMPLRWAVFAVVPSIVVPSHLFKSEHLLFAMLILWLLFRSWESAKNYWPVLLGLAVGFSFWIRLELIFPLAGVAFLGLELGHWLQKPQLKNRMFRRVGLFSGVMAAFWLPALYFPGVKNVGTQFLPFIIKIAKVGTGNLAWPKLSHISGSPDQVARFFLLWGILSFFFLLTIDLCRGISKSKRTELWGRRIVIFAMAFVGFYGAVFQSNLGHLLQVTAPVFLLVVDSGQRIINGPHRFSAKAAAGAATIGSLVALMVYALFISTTPEVGGISMRWNMKIPINSPLGTVYYHSPRAEFMQQTVDYIRGNTELDDTVAVLPLGTLLVTMSRRKNANSMLPVFPMLLDFLGPEFREKFYRDLMGAELIIYFEKPTRLEQPRRREQQLKYFNPKLFNMILNNYTLENRFGDYIVLRKSFDRSGILTAFMEGWEAYQYKNYEKADEYLKKALDLGGPPEAITPLLDDIRRYIE